MLFAATSDSSRVSSRVSALLLLLLTLVSRESGAQRVFRCELPDQAPVFSDRPCAPGAAVVELGPTNRADATEISDRYGLADRGRSEAGGRASGRRGRDSRRRSQDIACARAKDRLLSTRERWRALRRSGYTPRQQRDHEQRIREDERAVSTLCP